MLADEIGHKEYSVALKNVAIDLLTGGHLQIIETTLQALVEIKSVTQTRNGEHSPKSCTF